MRSPSPLWGEGRGEVFFAHLFWPGQWLRRQGRADFETFRQVAEQRGLLFGQHAGQPMPHATQQMFAPGRALKLPLPEGMIGKDHLRALREFVRQPLAHQMGEGGRAG